MNGLTNRNGNSGITPRQRVEMSLRHQNPDRVPVDFLATPEVWEKLIHHFGVQPAEPGKADLYEKRREEILVRLNVDCRVVSYDMFFDPPEKVIQPGANVDWWHSLNRSTPNRMWRQELVDGTFLDIWGRHSTTCKNDFGAYEEYRSHPLAAIETIEDAKQTRWPLPDWWNFTPLPGLLNELDRTNEYHIRFRAGSIFEVAWQLRGMETFLLDLVTQPEIAEYIMSALTDVSVANLERVLALAGDRIDSVYFYDDVATQNSLLISKKVWQRAIRPHHARIVETARRYGKHVMYHCDGAVEPLIRDLIEMGVDIINPIQVDVPGMDLDMLKKSYGERLTFHGGIDIINTLRNGTPDDVMNEVKSRIEVLGNDGGYILSSSHHIQPDTPVENILALYNMHIR